MSSATVLQVVAQHYKIPACELIGQERERRVSYPRFVAMWLLKHTGLSYPEVGAELGGRHHTTVMYGCETVRLKKQLLATACELAFMLGIEVLDVSPDAEEHW